MEQLVGTLIKEDTRNSRKEPYLAKAWDQSDAGKKWTFILRDNIECEDGTSIDAHSFIKGLKQSILRYLKKSEIPAFSQLKGFDSFKAGNFDSLGISALSNKKIEFSFEQKPDGFLDYLAMPYFGFYCSQDFEENGDWKNKNKITSSGAYRLLEVNEDNSILLKKRSNWFSHVKNSPDIVKIQYKGYKEIINKDISKTIIYNPKLWNKDEIPRGFYKVSAIPFFLRAIVLSPFKEGVFKKRENRTIFRDSIKRYIAKKGYSSLVATPAQTFYLSDTSNYIPTKKIKTIPNDGEKISILFYPKQTEFETYLKNLIESVCKEVGLNYEFNKIDYNNPNWIQEYRSNSKHDIRIAGVANGDTIISWVVDMMFCTKLGVSFPDPNNHICKLTAKYRKEEIDLKKYKKEFEKTIAKEASVIPIAHFGLMWLFSNDIPKSDISPTMHTPRFDLLQLK